MMSKRSAPPKSHPDAPRKRYKPAGRIPEDLGIEPAEVEQIHSAQQLQKLLILDTQATVKFPAGMNILENCLRSSSDLS